VFQGNSKPLVTTNVEIYAPPSRHELKSLFIRAGGPMLKVHLNSYRLVEIASRSKRNKEAADVADLRFIAHDSINPIECPIIPILAGLRARIRNNQGIAVDPVTPFDPVNIVWPKQVLIVFTATGELNPDRNRQPVRPNVVG
jgi:hypothetical protein